MVQVGRRNGMDSILAVVAVGVVVAISVAGAARRRIARRVPIGGASLEHRPDETSTAHPASAEQGLSEPVSRA